MTKHIPPAPEPIEDEELAEFLGTSGRAKKPTKAAVRKSAKPAPRPDRFVQEPHQIRRTTDGFSRPPRKPVDITPEPAAAPAPTTLRNPSVKNRGRIMDFVPRVKPTSAVEYPANDLAEEIYDEYDEPEVYEPESYEPEVYEPETFADDDYDQLEDFVDDDPIDEAELAASLVGFEDDFVSEPQPFNTDNFHTKEYVTPFLTSVTVEKRPLSSHISEQKPIPEPVDRPLSSSSKKPYEPAITPHLTEHNTFKSNRGQGKPEFTMITPSKPSNTIALVFAVLGTILVGAIVGGLAYLILLQ